MNKTQISELMLLPTHGLQKQAVIIRDSMHPTLISYSKKVFIPLTRLCRDVCHYCTFSTTPKRGVSAFLNPHQIIEIAKAGELAGCTEALFTLGDKPELRYESVRQELQQLGYTSTIEYLAAMCAVVLAQTRLLPHVNAGLMTLEEMALLKKVSVSQGLMLETSSQRLMEKGQVHHGSPDKEPLARLAMIENAGIAGIPFTTGILIGIGETREERIEALLQIKALHDKYGHIQEVIIQNFRAKVLTKAAQRLDPTFEELAWTVAVARIILGAAMNIQAPPNLSPTNYADLIGSGINDWGGISPVTPDHVNPEAPWPHIEQLREQTTQKNKYLIERLPIYPSYAIDQEKWVDASLKKILIQSMDVEGYARNDDWSPGLKNAIPKLSPITSVTQTSNHMASILSKPWRGESLTEAEICTLFKARGADFHLVCQTADRLRSETVGETVRYVVTRNINYTNVCQYKCQFCAFAKGQKNTSLKGPSYDLAIEEILRRVHEAHDRGASEVCMQGGIHPGYTGETYLSFLKAIKQEIPQIHIHAFSPLEVTHGAETMGISVTEFLLLLKKAGLGSLPGTAAEILSDDVRQLICPDKLNTNAWLDVVSRAHEIGLKTTSTIMFGHLEKIEHWAKHLIEIKNLQIRTGGVTEFVPLPFVHMEAPMYFKGLARKGPTYRESILMHAIARLALHPHVSNIQTSWVKLGKQGVLACLSAGANDLGGTLMNESISNAAGSQMGQEMSPLLMDQWIREADRLPQQRTTLYGTPQTALVEKSYEAKALNEMIQTPAGKLPNHIPVLSFRN